MISLFRFVSNNAGFYQDTSVSVSVTHDGLKCNCIRYIPCHNSSFGTI